MKYSLLVLLGMTMVAAGSAWAVSDSGFTTPDDSPVISDPRRVPVPPTATAVGRLTTKDSVRQFIQLQNAAGQVLSFYVDSNTPIYDRARRQLAFEELQPGDPVAVNFSLDSSTINEIDRLRG